MSQRIHLLGKIQSQVAVLMLRKNEILSFKHMQRVMLPEHIQQFSMQRQTSKKGCSVSISSNL